MTYQSLRTRSVVASAGIVFLVVANVVFDATGLMLELNDPSAVAAWSSAGAMLIFGTVIAAVLFLVWFNRAAWNLRALHPHAPFQFTPGWCCGWFFVPLANLVKPVQAMREVWKYSDPDAVSGDVFLVEVPALITVWWVAYIGSGIVGNASSRIDDLHLSTYVGMASTALSAVAAVCILSIMRTITANQETAFAAREKLRHLEDTLKHAADVVG